MNHLINEIELENMDKSIQSNGSQTAENLAITRNGKSMSTLQIKTLESELENEINKVVFK